MYGMGTFICIVPVFSEPRDPNVMIARGLNSEHHAIPGKYVTFIYNEGGALFKWFRDTFARAERQLAREAGEDIYAKLLAEIPDGPSEVTVLPRFSATGRPDLISDACGVIVGLRLDTAPGRHSQRHPGGDNFLREGMGRIAARYGYPDHRLSSGGGRQQVRCLDSGMRRHHGASLHETQGDRGRGSGSRHHGGSR